MKPKSKTYMAIMTLILIFTAFVLKSKYEWPYKTRIVTLNQTTNHSHHQLQDQLNINQKTTQEKRQIASLQTSQEDLPPSSLTYNDEEKEELDKMALQLSGQDAPLQSQILDHLKIHGKAKHVPGILMIPEHASPGIAIKRNQVIMQIAQRSTSPDEIEYLSLVVTNLLHMDNNNPHIISEQLKADIFNGLPKTKLKIDSKIFNQEIAQMASPWYKNQVIEAARLMKIKEARPAIEAYLNGIYEMEKIHGPESLDEILKKTLLEGDMALEEMEK